MPDVPSWLLGAAVLLGIGLVATVILVLTSRSRTNQLGPPHSPGQRLALLARQRSDYRILVGIPPDQPTSWIAASRVSDDTVTTEGHGDIPLATVTAFVVAYPNGQVIDYESAGLPVPSGMTGLSPGRKRDHDILQPTDLEPGRQYIEVKFGRSAMRPHDRNHYSTTLTNISRQRVRVVRFAGYTPTAEGWKLNTVTGSFYSAQEFRAWYGLGQSEWIEPGGSVADPNNYGSPPTLWAYYCQAEGGEEFIAGGVLE